MFETRIIWVTKLLPLRYYKVKEGLRGAKQKRPAVLQTFLLGSPAGGIKSLIFFALYKNCKLPKTAKKLCINITLATNGNCDQADSKKACYKFKLSNR